MAALLGHSGSIIVDLLPKSLRHTSRHVNIKAAGRSRDGRPGDRSDAADHAVGCYETPLTSRGRPSPPGGQRAVPAPAGRGPEGARGAPRGAPLGGGCGSPAGCPGGWSSWSPRRGPVPSGRRSGADNEAPLRGGWSGASSGRSWSRRRGRHPTVGPAAGGVKAFRCVPWTHPGECQAAFISGPGGRPVDAGPAPPTRRGGPAPGPQRLRRRSGAPARWIPPAAPSPASWRRWRPPGRAWTRQRRSGYGRRPT
jgi:hypothetical protein